MASYVSRRATILNGLLSFQSFWKSILLEYLESFVGGPRPSSRNSFRKGTLLLNLPWGRVLA